MNSKQEPDEAIRSEDRGTKSLDLNQPCRVAKVNFEGVHRTQPGLLAKIVADVFKANTTLNCLERCIKAKENLAKLGAFNDIEILMKKPKDESTSATRESIDTYDVTFAVHEKGRLAGSLKTSVDYQHTHLDIRFSLPNLTGYADLIEFKTKLHKKLYSGEARYSIPLRPWKTLWAPIYSFSYSQNTWDNQPSGYDQEDKSILNQVDFHSLPQLKHSINFENIWRYIRSSSLKTPIQVREQSGHSVKSSLKHVLTWDNTIGGNYPYEGILARLSNEFCLNLINGSTKFTRHEVHLQFNQMLMPKYDVLLQLNLLAGTLLKPTKINICDKFFAGGALTLRGFEDQGLAPNVGKFPLGDASYLATGLHIYSILPYTTPESGINDYIRPHLFLNAGTIGNINDIFRLPLSSRDDLRRESLRFWRSFRYSCGFGLVMYFFRMRLEINYCFPLEVKQNDLRHDGLQFGFGLYYT